MPHRTCRPGSIAGMDYGLCLPNFRAGASREGMEAAAEGFDATDPEEVSGPAEPFAREVAPLV